MYGIKDKLISVRVCSDEYKLVMDHLRKDASWNRTTFADLVEKTIRDYIKENKLG